MLLRFFFYPVDMRLNVLQLRVTRTDWEECLDERAIIGGEMHQFTVLFTSCTDDLPREEHLKMCPGGAEWADCLSP